MFNVNDLYCVGYYLVIISLFKALFWWRDNVLLKDLFLLIWKCTQSKMQAWVIQKTFLYDMCALRNLYYFAKSFL